MIVRVQYQCTLSKNKFHNTAFCIRSEIVYLEISGLFWKKKKKKKKTTKNNKVKENDSQIPKEKKNNQKCIRKLKKLYDTKML